MIVMNKLQASVHAVDYIINNGAPYDDLTGRVHTECVYI